LIGPIYDRLLGGSSRRVERFGKNIGRVHEVVIIADDTSYNWDDYKHSKECGGSVHDQMGHKREMGILQDECQCVELNKATVTK
jgi:hypothetical protein